MGMKIIASPFVEPVPVIAIRHDFNYCSEEFKSKMNKWLLETFGTKEVMYFIGNDSVVMSPKNYAMIKNLSYSRWKP